MQPNYHYDDWVNEAIQRLVRSLFPPGTPLKRVSLQDDFGGIDFRYEVHHSVPLQVRARFNRPAYAADSDITFRTTEPAMITAHTYAPLALFVWFVGHVIVAAKLIDVYGMAARLTPTLADRPRISNGDGTGFLVVEMGELHAVSAVLRLNDGQVWATATLGGEMRMNRIVSQWKPPVPVR
jgi:hypothetical protein